MSLLEKALARPRKAAVGHLTSEDRAEREAVALAWFRGGVGSTAVAAAMGRKKPTVAIPPMAYALKRAIAEGRVRLEVVK